MVNRLSTDDEKDMALQSNIQRWLRNARTKKVIFPAGVLLVVALATVQFPHSISLHGKIMPAQRWILTRAENGQVSYMTVNYMTGMQDGYYTNQMERGEIVSLKLQPELARRDRVRYQDTMAVLTSSDAEEQMAALKGERDIATADLIASRTGEKQSVIEVYRHRLEQARSVAEEKKNIAERAGKLYEKKLISLEECEVAANAARVAQAEVESAMAQLTDMRTGVKPEEIQLLEARIESLNRQIEIKGKRIKSYTILAPFSGAIETLVHSDTLLILSDDSKHMVLMPVRPADCSALHPGMTVTCRTVDTGESFSAIIRRIGLELHYVNGESSRLVVAELDRTPTRLSPGSILPCTISVGRASVMTTVAQAWR